MTGLYYDLVIVKSLLSERLFVHDNEALLFIRLG